MSVNSDTNTNVSELTQDVNTGVVERITKQEKINLPVPVEVFDPHNRELLEPFTIYSFRIGHDQHDHLDHDCEKLDLNCGEHRLAIDAYMEHIKTKFPHRVGINSKSFVSFKPYDVRNGIVLVKVFTGGGRPDGLETYQRIVYGKTDDGKSLVRWSRVEQVKEVTSGNDSTSSREQFLGQYRRFQFVLHANAKRTDLRALIAEANDENNSECANKARAAINALLKYEFCRDNDSMIVHGNKFFDRSPNELIQEVELRTGTTRSLRIAGDRIVLCEKDCHQLFYPPVSVNRFMEMHGGSYVASGHSAFGKQMTEMLKGVRVKLLGPKHNWTASISAISGVSANKQKLLLAASKMEMRVADHYANEGYNLRYPNSACVNVGSAESPYYVPSELCSILPHQCFKRAMDPALQRKVEMLLREKKVNRVLVDDEEDLDDPPQPPGSSLVKSEPYFHYSKFANWHNSRMRLARILLVEVGREPFQSSAWTQFQAVLRNMSRRPWDENAPQNGSAFSTIADVEPNVLHLQFTGSDKCLEDWVAKLQQRIEKIKLPGPGKISIAVFFGIQNSSERPEIFKLIKKACNHESIGVQSIGVNVTTLRTKINKDPSLSLVHYCGQMYRKIFARTPLLEKSRGAVAAPETFNLALALHVTKYNAPGQREPFYLIAFASREMSQARCYHTTIRLIGVNRIMEDVLDAFREHMNKLEFMGDRDIRDFVLFRSGVALPDSDPVSPSSVVGQHGTDVPSGVEKRIGGVWQDPLDELAERTNSLELGERQLNIEVDSLVSAMRPHFRGRSTGRRLFPIFVSEDKGYNLSIASEEIAKDVDQFRLHNCKESKRHPKAIYFVHNEGLVNSKRRELSIHLHNAGKNNEMFTKLTMLDAQIVTPAIAPHLAKSPPSYDLTNGRSRSEVSNDTSGRRNVSMSKRSRQASGQQVGTSGSRHVSRQDRPYGMPYHQYLEIHSETKWRLAEVFYDNHLGIHESKWPIPTHLARRVTGWACSHMEFTTEEVTAVDGTGKYQGVRPSLPVVHRNRQDTLWYL